MFPLNRPMVMVSRAGGLIDENGQITDDHTKEKIEELLTALVAWTKKLS